MKHRFILSTLALIAVFAFTAVVNAAPVKTIKNLKDAFTGETTASAKYAAYAKKAKAEGKPAIAVLFEAASKSESIHASNHRAVLEQLGEKAPDVTPKFEVKSTKENLEDAIKGESYEAKTMYPTFLKEATQEKAKTAMMSLNYAYKTEQRHQVLYEAALKALNGKTLGTLPAQYQVCITCGNTYENEAPARCGICMTAKEKFITFK